MHAQRHLALLSAVALTGCNVDIYGVNPTTAPINGRVVDMDGDPLGGAVVSVLDAGSWVEQGHSDAQGWFETDKLEGNHWIRVEADGYLTRVRPAGHAEAALFRLSQSDGTTARLVFAGSTTFGPGFYEPSNDGIMRAGWEPSDLPVALAGMLPLLEATQLTNLVLEGPLSTHPEAHPEKSAVYRNQPLVAVGLAAAGFDFVHLANDHSYDLLEDGLVETLAQLEAAGLLYQGAGLDQTEAWTADTRDVGAVRVAQLGCTTVTGADYDISLVAEDGKAGAAACDREWLEPHLTQAAEQTDVTILHLHGGTSLDPVPTEWVEELAELAAQSGAGLIINGHPRVNGGISMVDDAVLIESLGALATDLTLWSTFPSALLEVQFDRDGVLQRVTLEPLLRDSLRPMAVLDWPRQRIARDMLASSSALVALDGGALELDLHGRSKLEERQLDAQADGGGWSHPIDLRDGWLSEVSGVDDWQLGTDLLRVGDFEDIDVDDHLAEGFLWTLDSSYEWVSDQAAFEGAYGLRLLRDASHNDAVYTNPAHRMPVTPGQQLTVAGQLRTKGQVELQVSWYEDTSGSSFERSTQLLEAAKDWTPFAIDVEVPAGATAANLYLKLHPSERGRVLADLDQLRIVAWESSKPDDTLAFDALRVQGSGSYTMRRRVMPVSSY